MAHHHDLVHHHGQDHHVQHRNQFGITARGQNAPDDDQVEQEVYNPDEEQYVVRELDDELNQDRGRVLGFMESALGPRPSPSPRCWFSLALGRNIERDLRNYQPVRLQFTQGHPLAERADDWFSLYHYDLFTRVWNFAQSNFEHKNISRDTASLWSLPFSKSFTNLVSKVAKHDINVGGWDRLLQSRETRTGLVVGVIAKMLQVGVFDDLLFGSDNMQWNMLDLQDETTLQLEGYNRTELRARTVRAVLADDTLTPLFWPSVDRLAMQITTTLLPMIDIMDHFFPANKNTHLKTIHQEIHNIVAEAAHLHLCMRLSRTIFDFYWPYLGERWDMEQEHHDDRVYNRSKAVGEAIDNAELEEYEIARGEQEKREKAETKDRMRLEALLAMDPKTLSKGKRREIKLLRSRLGVGRINYMRLSAYRLWHGQPRPVPPHFDHTIRAGKVQMVLWPALKRYCAVGPIMTDDDYYTGQEGETISTISKARVYYYAGVSEGGDERLENIPTLEEHIKSVTLTEELWWRLLVVPACVLFVILLCLVFLGPWIGPYLGPYYPTWLSQEESRTWNHSALKPGVQAEPAAPGMQHHDYQTGYSGGGS